MLGMGWLVTPDGQTGQAEQGRDQEQEISMGQDEDAMTFGNQQGHLKQPGD